MKDIDELNNMLWVDLWDFPLYDAHPEGYIRNRSSGKILKPILNNSGSYFVQLRHNGKSSIRSVNRLIAEMFCPEPEGMSDADDISQYSPIHLDGDKTNFAASNLAWRTRHFAIRWSRQMREGQQYWDNEVIFTPTGQVYPSPWAAALDTGNLEEDIHYMAVQTYNDPVYDNIWQFTRKRP